MMMIKAFFIGSLVFVILFIFSLAVFNDYRTPNDEETVVYYAYVVNTGKGTITVIDTVTDTVINEIHAGIEISDGLATNRKLGKIYTTNASQDSLLVFDGYRYEFLYSIDLERNIHGIDISSDDRYLYLTSGSLEEGHENNYIMIFDTEENQLVVEYESAAKSPTHISFSNDGRFAFISNVVSSDVSIFDTALGRTIRTIPVGRVPNNTKPAMDDKKLYVATLLDNNVVVVDLETNKVIEKIPAGEGTHGIAVTEDNQMVWTTNRFSSDVTIINTENKQVIKTLKAGNVPNYVIQVPNSNKMYVSNYESGDITVIDISTFETINTISVGEKPHEIGFLPKKSIDVDN
ncbi:YncE family protein [Alkaliphilus peptidifermentans]|uniref:40-residue YVTN family beta-propeller repeat-containing protein n=1 Tax=Alkaliphilus peptidifermentans DSM 18978 TaxID=1120976 RepID=A0A1G5DPT2_9FIRM|nr:YncE family protein [Alkaliphilus peptidifermentans]SCY16695.1 40-residue YVTN family beta-propeller repeat-containing protein [Alkaliphilus peptidifermentans DSM 18978]